MSTAFSAFFVHVACFSFYALLQLHHEKSENEQKTRKKNFFMYASCPNAIAFAEVKFFSALMLMLCGNDRQRNKLLKIL